jgi:hypothetical protein
MSVVGIGAESVVESALKVSRCGGGDGCFKKKRVVRRCRMRGRSEKREFRRMSELGGSVSKGVGDEGFGKLFTAEIGKMSRTAEETKRGCLVHEAHNLDAVTQAITPQASCGRHDYLVGFVKAEFVGADDAVVFGAKFEEMRAHGEGVSSAKREGHAGLGCKEAFGLDGVVGQSGAQGVERRGCMGVAPTAHESKRGPNGDRAERVGAGEFGSAGGTGVQAESPENRRRKRAGVSASAIAEIGKQFRPNRGKCVEQKAEEGRVPNRDEPQIGLTQQAEQRDVTKGFEVRQVAQCGRSGKDRGDEAGPSAAEVVAVVGESDGNG